MHSVADRFYPSQNSISEVMHSDALYVHLGHCPDDFYDTLFIGSCFQSTKWFLDMHFFKTQYSLTGNLYIIILQMFEDNLLQCKSSISWRRECKRWFGATSYETSAVKCNSSCGILITRAICHNCSEFLLCRGRSFRKPFWVSGRTLFFFFLLKDAAPSLFGVIRLLRTSSSSRFADSS